MNSSEQRGHKRVMDDLAKGLEDLAEAVELRCKRVEARVEALMLGLTDEGIARRENDLALTVELRRELRAFRDRTVFGRVKWLLVGR